MIVITLKVESEKVGLRLNIQKTKIMASGPHHFMGNRWETVETVLDIIFFSSKITAGDCKTMELKDTYSLEEKL